MIIIESKKDGFRRCGIAHSARPTEYPDDRFTAEELKALETEPMLMVSRLEEADEKDNAPEKSKGRNKPKPDAVKPDAVKPGADKPGADKPDADKPDADKE